MAGLFDLFSEDPQQAAYLALAAGLLGGRGSFNNVLGQSLLGAQQAYGGATDAQMKRQLMKAQMGDIAAQEELRKQQAKKLEEGQRLLAEILSQPAQTTNQYGAGGSGLSLGGVSEPMIPVAKKAGLSGATPEQIAALKAQGMDISNIWELAQFGKQMQPGYRQTVGGGMEYYAKPGEPTVDPRTGKVSLPPGTAESVGTLAGATTGAQEAAKSPYSLVDFITPSGEPRKTTLDLFKLMQGQQASSDKMGAIQRDMLATGVPTANFDIGGISGTLNAPKPGVKSGLSPEEQATAAASKEYQTARAKSQATDMETIQQKGLAAPSRIATLKYIGDLYNGFEGGTLSNFAMKVASTANSIGIPIDPKLGDKEAAAAIANKMSLELRNTGQGGGMPGALSDSDREFLRSMTPQLAQTAKGRKQIIDSHVALANRDAEVAQFARNYEAKYGRVDGAFFTQLAEWSKANPLFSK